MEPYGMLGSNLGQLATCKANVLTCCTVSRACPSQAIFYNFIAVIPVSNSKSNKTNKCKRNTQQQSQAPSSQEIASRMVADVSHKTIPWFTFINFSGWSLQQGLVSF